MDSKFVQISASKPNNLCSFVFHAWDKLIPNTLRLVIFSKNLREKMDVLKIDNKYLSVINPIAIITLTL
jgi:hypothetical protein